MIYKKDFEGFIAVQKGMKSYSEWKKEIERDAEYSNEDLEDIIKESELTHDKYKTELQLNKSGIGSYYISLFVAFITTLASGIYSIYSTLNSVAISLSTEEREEMLNVIGKNTGYQTLFISFACIVIIAFFIIVTVVIIGLAKYKSYKINKMLFLEEKIKILKEVATKNM